MMADKPILFSGPMVRALIAGTKTQTRRTINQEIWAKPEIVEIEGKRPYWAVFDGDREAYRVRIPYAVGDRLYVREHWRVSNRWDDTPPRDLEPRKMSVVLEAGGSIANEGDPLRWVPSDWPNGERPDWIGRFRQGMHMPRWASRLTLTVTDVRVERLLDITEVDARAEGVESIVRPDGTRIGIHVVIDEKVIGGWVQPRYRDVYETLWEHLNGPGSWDANPWVAAYTFTVERGNIDNRGAD